MPQIRNFTERNMIRKWILGYPRLPKPMCRQSIYMISIWISCGCTCMFQVVQSKSSSFLVPQDMFIDGQASFAIPKLPRKNVSSLNHNVAGEYPIKMEVYSWESHPEMRYVQLPIDSIATFDCWKVCFGRFLVPLLMYMALSESRVPYFSYSNDWHYTQFSDTASRSVGPLRPIKTRLNSIKLYTFHYSFHLHKGHKKPSSTHLTHMKFHKTSWNSLKFH